MDTTLLEKHKRDFLNLNKGMAAFEYSIDAGQYEGSSKLYVNGRFCVSDCSRKVELDFDSYDEDDRKNAMHKTDSLVNALQEFREYMVQAHELQRGDKTK